jgi:hypothetical protein
MGLWNESILSELYRKQLDTGMCGQQPPLLDNTDSQSLTHTLTTPLSQALVLTLTLSLTHSLEHTFFSYGMGEDSFLRKQMDLVRK